MWLVKRSRSNACDNPMKVKLVFVKFEACGPTLTPHPTSGANTTLNPSKF